MRTLAIALGRASPRWMLRLVFSGVARAIRRA